MGHQTRYKILVKQSWAIKPDTKYTAAKHRNCNGGSVKNHLLKIQQIRKFSLIFMKIIGQIGIIAYIHAIIYIAYIASSRIWHLAVVTRLERVEDDSDYTYNVQRYWKGAFRDSRRRPCPTKPFQLAMGQRGKVWPTPSYHESHRKTNTGRSCWVNGFKSRPNRIA